MHYTINTVIERVTKSEADSETNRQTPERGNGLNSPKRSILNISNEFNALSALNTLINNKSDMMIKAKAITQLQYSGILATNKLLLKITIEEITKQRKQKRNYKNA